MLYDISLTIAYRYEIPAAGGRHHLRLLPREAPGQRVIAAALDLDPRPGEWTTRADFWGNPVTEVAYREAQEELTFRLAARVDRRPVAEELDLSVPPDRIGAEIAADRSVAPGAPHHFTGPSPRILPDPGVTALARAAATGASTLRRAVAAVGRAVGAEMAYVPGATSVETPLAEAFGRRQGVCQDFAHVMIAGLRGIGIPAGYVSGFLRTEPPPGRPRLEGADAMHAWVRAWCGDEAGWVEFDPTNGVFAGEDHVTVAWGRDYGDVAPVRGVLRLTGAQTSRQAVDMVAVG